jgi:hypothetical protein
MPNLTSMARGGLRPCRFGKLQLLDEVRRTLPNIISAFAKGMEMCHFTSHEEKPFFGKRSVELRGLQWPVSELQRFGEIKFDEVGFQNARRLRQALEGFSRISFSGTASRMETVTSTQKSDRGRLRVQDSTIKHSATLSRLPWRGRNQSGGR